MSVEAVGDSVILSLSEALKAAVRETTHLGGRVANSTAAALVNFLFLPGYSYFSRARYDLPDFSALTPARVAEFLNEALKEVSFLRSVEEADVEPDGLSGESKRDVHMVPHFARWKSNRKGFKRFVGSIFLRLLSFRALFMSSMRHSNTEVARISERGAKVLHHFLRSNAVKDMSRSGTKVIPQNAGLLEDFTDALIFKIDAATAWMRNKYGKLFHMSKARDGWPLLALFETAPALPDPATLVLEKSSSHTASVIDRVCGYPVECINVKTLDGYYVRLVRIPHKHSRKVVFFQHGLLDSSAAWVSNGHIFSLGLRAFQEGYDVFLGNLRGTRDTSLQPPPKESRSQARPRSRSIGVSSKDSESHEEKQDALPKEESRRSKRTKRLRRVRGKSAEKASEPVDSSGFRRMHKYLNLSDSQFWSYSVDDHALDMMALIQKVHEIKQSERKYWQNRREQLSPVLRPRQTSEERPRLRSWADVLRSSSDESRQGGGAGAPASGAHSGASSSAKHLSNPGSASRDSASQQYSSSASEASHYSSVTIDPQEEGKNYVLTAIGHSMGGAILLFYLLHMRALGLAHRVSKAIFLSPAGYHEDIVPILRYPLKVINKVLRYSSDGPFPSYNSTLQRMIAKLLEDVKRSPAATDLLASFASSVLGGEPQNFVFRHVDFVEYPIGGTSRRVIQQGVQVMNANQTQTFDHGRKENMKRFGTAEPVSYKRYYSLYDVPMHFVAGGKDSLIPPTNLRKQNAWINEASPGISTLKEFDVLGHMDFTLGVDDDVISHVLKEIRKTTYHENANRMDALQVKPYRSAEQSAELYPFLNSYYFRDEVFAKVNRWLENLAMAPRK